MQKQVIHNKVTRTLNNIVKSEWNSPTEVRLSIMDLLTTTEQEVFKAFKYYKIRGVKVEFKCTPPVAAVSPQSVLTSDIVHIPNVLPILYCWERNNDVDYTISRMKENPNRKQFDPYKGYCKTYRGLLPEFQDKSGNNLFLNKKSWISSADTTYLYGRFIYMPNIISTDALIVNYNFDIDLTIYYSLKTLQYTI